MKKYLPISLALVIIILIVLSVNGNRYYASEIFQDENSLSIYYEQKLVRNEGAYLINTQPYLPCSLMDRYFDKKDMVIDEINSLIRIDLKNKNIILGNQELENYIKANVTCIEIPLIKIEERYYFPADVMKSFFHIRYEVKDEEIRIYKNDGNVLLGKVNKSRIKMKPSVLDPEAEDIYLDYNDRVQIIKETDNYYKVEAENITGYIEKDDLIIDSVDYGSIDYYGDTKEKKDYAGKDINLIWEYVNKYTPEPTTEKIEAIDIVSPTWFYLKDGEGNVANKADKGYANQVKNQGYDLWGLMTNSFSGVWTNAVLCNDALVDKVIAQMLFYSSLYDLDGINIDFESVNDSDRDNLTNFMKKLRYYTELQGLHLSIDVLVPRSWTIEYDRKALSNYVDYIATMTYDEHWSGCTEAGSVASYNWVEDGVSRTLKEGVPREKLLLGIPLYTRLWTTENGKVSSKTLYMADVKKIVEEKNLNRIWLDDAKQYYVQYEEAGKLYQIWIEDSQSVEWKKGLIDKYNLRGSAYWRKGFESEDFWND